MANFTLHVYPTAAGWQVKTARSKARSFANRKLAIAAAVARLNPKRKRAVVVHDKDGSVIERLCVGLPSLQKPIRKSNHEDAIRRAVGIMALRRIAADFAVGNL